MLNRENVVEIWRQYPPIEWLYGSNLGNLKTVDHYTVRKDGKRQFVKGRDLKQYRELSGYMRVTLAIDGKTIHLSVHRVITMCFVPNPENLEQVNHKDCNRANNCVWNLEWVSNRQNITYREKYGVPAAESTKVLRKPLFAVNLKTGEVSHFASQHEAERKTGVDQRNISMVIRSKRSQAGGYYFTENEDEITKEKLQVIKDSRYFWGGVIAINLETQEPLYFKTRKEAADSLGCFAEGVGNVIAGRQKHTHGFWFCHADNNAVEATRDKFGDEVANKVAELMSEKVS